MRLLPLLATLLLTGCASDNFYDRYIAAWESKSSVEHVAMDQAGCTYAVRQKLDSLPESDKVEELQMSWNSIYSHSFTVLPKNEKRAIATNLCQEILTEVN